jgi:hypothetical protein
MGLTCAHSPPSVASGPAECIAVGLKGLEMYQRSRFANPIRAAVLAAGMATRFGAMGLFCTTLAACGSDDAQTRANPVATPPRDSAPPPPSPMQPPTQPVQPPAAAGGSAAMAALAGDGGRSAASAAAGVPGSGGMTASGSGGMSAAGGGGAAGSGDEPAFKTNFFVTSDKSMTGNLGGLAAADTRCQKLAEAAGFGAKTWLAYLSVESGDDGMPVHARDRIGSGPWYNAADMMLAADVAALHARTGDVELFLDEKGERVPGSWSGSPQPNEHDVLTGSTPEGMLAMGQTCDDWTSEATGVTAMVGHTDGLGPGGSSMAPYSSWNSSHENFGCNDTGPGGGAGRLYCFAP